MTNDEPSINPLSCSSSSSIERQGENHAGLVLRNEWQEARAVHQTMVAMFEAFIAQVKADMVRMEAEQKLMIDRIIERLNKARDERIQKFKEDFRRENIERAQKEEREREANEQKLKDDLRELDQKVKESFRGKLDHVLQAELEKLERRSAERDQELGTPQERLNLGNGRSFQKTQMGHRSLVVSPDESSQSVGHAKEAVAGWHKTNKARENSSQFVLSLTSGVQTALRVLSCVKKIFATFIYLSYQTSLSRSITLLPLLVRSAQINMK